MEELVPVVNHLRFEHFAEEVVALARPLANACEHGKPFVLLGNVVDELHDEDRLADACAAEEADLAATRVGLNQVDNLDAGLEHLDVRGQLVVAWWVGVDGAVALGLRLRQSVDNLAHHIKKPATDLGADRHGDGLARVDNGRASREAIRGVHGDSTHTVLAEVLLHFENERAEFAAVDLEGVEDLRYTAAGELNVHNGADHLQHFAV